tara:strand:+ start:324 stop:635 length:312 start_codon:yes stop_codon:yes gene_type:complete
MNCPMCKKSTQVKDSRAYEDNQVRRRRVCTSCKYSFYTLEARVQEKINVNKLRRGVNQVTSGTIRPKKKKVLPARRQEPRTRYDEFEELNGDDFIDLKELGID